MQKKFDNEGYVPINRKFFNHPLWKEGRTFSKAEAWLDLIQSARFEASMAKELIGGRLVSWTTGQLPASVRLLAQKWNWTKGRVENFLKLLESEGMIRKEIVEGQTVITLVNYSNYNKNGQRNGQANAVGTGLSGVPPDRSADTGRTVNGHRPDNTNKENKENKEEEGIGAFAPVYSSEDLKLFNAFKEWIGKYAPNVGKMKEPFTIEQYLKLKKSMAREKMQDLILKMHNWKPLLQKNISAYRTILNWNERRDHNDHEPNSIHEKLKAAGNGAK